MNKRTIATGLGVAMILSGFMFGLSVSARAQQTDSRLYHITKSGILRVCQWPQYYAISYRNPSTGQIEGIDADLAKELAKELGAKLEIVDSSFVTFIADLQTNKCDIGMFGVAATLKRAQAVEFSKPYLTVGIYAIVKKNGPIKTWADIDKPGIRVADTLGSYTEPFMRSYLKHATLHAVSAPATNEGELSANRADASVMYAYTVAQGLVHVLKACGDNLTRENVMKQAASIKDLELGGLLPGIKVNTSATDFAPLSQLQLQKFKGDTWERFGEILNGDVGG